MGACWCNHEMLQDEDVYLPTVQRMSKSVDIKIVDHLVLDMLRLIASCVDNFEESPVSLVKLHMIADKEEGWIQVVSSMVNIIPLENPFGPSAIAVILDDCPLPSKDSVIRVTSIFGLSEERATTGELNVRVERNICVVLGFIAEKLAGPNSVAVLNKDTLEYLFAFLVTRREPPVVLFALIALEKFSLTTENKLTIKDKFNMMSEHPLLVLEEHVNSEHFLWRQVGFCAQWALDNLFIIESRTLSYKKVDNSKINALLNSHDVSEYLKISADGLEARTDSNSFESVRCTFQVDSGCWYYECLIITPGVMQIGWATKNSHFSNYDGFGIGDDVYSLSFDGSRMLMWYKARPSPIKKVPPWKAGDVVGCLIDMNKKEMVFSLNGTLLPPRNDIFNTTRNGFFAAASFMAFQQCRFNFGLRPFVYPPTDRAFCSFNDYGRLTQEQKQVVPRRLYLAQLISSTVEEDSCTLCYDDVACCILEPCGHRGFCSICTSQLKECPMCRAAILNVRIE